MKKIILSALAASVAASASAFDPKDLLGNLGKLNGDTTSTTGDSQSTGGVLGSLGSLIGTWSYSSPAVSFQSENALMKIGGAGAATAVENQLAPYYQRLGFTNTSLTVDADHNFTLKMGLLVLKGTVEKDEEDNGLVFNFNAFGKISLGKVKANATKAGKTLNLTFDATRLIQMLTKISSKLNIKTLSTLSTILNNYDGIYIGYKLKQ